MKWTVLGVLSLLLCSVMPTSVSAETEIPALIEIERIASGVKTLSSDFVQEKHLNMFDEVLISKGRFYVEKPDRLRWEMTEPVASGFALSGKRGRRWHGPSGRTETFNINRDPVMKLVTEQLLAWARADFDWLQKQFQIQVLKSSPVILRLEPRDEGTKAYLVHLRIGFAAGGGHVELVEMHERGGDFTRMIFKNTQINPTLSRELF